MAHINVFGHTDARIKVGCYSERTSSLRALLSCDTIYHMDAKTLEKICLMIARLPDAKKWEKDQILGSEFFALSEDESLPEAVRDFCVDASLLADGIDTGPLVNASKQEILEKFETIKNDHSKGVGR